MDTIARMLLVLTLASGCAVHAQPLEIFGATITVTDNCDLRYEKDGTVEAIESDIDTEGFSCRVVTHKDTNVPQLVYVNGMFVFLVEANIEEEDGRCLARYRGVGVGRDDKPRLSELRESGTCYSDRDHREFEYLSNTME